MFDVSTMAGIFVEPSADLRMMSSMIAAAAALASQPRKGKMLTTARPNSVRT